MNEVAGSLPSHVDGAPMEPLPLEPARTMHGVFRDARQRTRVSVGAAGLLALLGAGVIAGLVLGWWGPWVAVGAFASGSLAVTQGARARDRRVATFAAEVTPRLAGLELVISTRDGKGRGDPRLIPWDTVLPPEAVEHRRPRRLGLLLSWRGGDGTVEVPAEPDPVELGVLWATIRGRMVASSTPAADAAGEAKAWRSRLLDAVGLGAAAVGLPAMSVVNHGLRWTLVAWLPFTVFQLRRLYRDVAAWLRWRRQRREASLAAACSPTASEAIAAGRPVSEPAVTSAVEAQPRP